MMHPAAMTPNMQIMGHSAYPPGAAYPPTQPDAAAGDVSQHGQVVGGPPAQPWPGQRGPPVPYPTPIDGVQCGPASVHPTVSQRTSRSGEYSRDGTSPATPHQFNPGSHQGMMMDMPPLPDVVSGDALLHDGNGVIEDDVGTLVASQDNTGDWRKDVNATDKDGYTPLHYAVQTGQNTGITKLAGIRQRCICGSS
ncbi:unnamed protein product [Cylicocyclus nassatus]|uniref:Uncharacterized protein n=1 Tax=Cylicocyclus nassatus TaxID=53992 RepID=A0AA36MEI7_CYLNA|nr:unnamed protein product [Cylicocyclus nassatus]